MKINTAALCKPHKKLKALVILSYENWGVDYTISDPSHPA